MNTWWPYEKLIEDRLGKFMRDDRKQLNKANSREMYLEKREYYLDDLLKELHELNVYLYPDKEELITFAKQFCLKQEKRSQRKYGFLQATWYLPRMFRQRQAVEVLSMLGYPPSYIQFMINYDNFKKDSIGEFIADYIDFFFNYPGMSAAQRDLFFSRVREVPYYRLHCAVHFQTISPQMALAALGVQFDNYIMSNACRIDRLIQQTTVRLEEALLENDNKRISTLSQSLGSLSKSFLKLGGETEQSEKQVEIQYICYSKFEPELTVEQIREHNARIRAEREKQGNSDNPNEPAKPDGSVNPAKPGEPNNSTNPTDPNNPTDLADPDNSNDPIGPVNPTSESPGKG